MKILILLKLDYFNMNKKIICEEQWLKGNSYINASKLDGITHSYWCDLEKCERSIYMVGTPEQISELCCEMIEKDMIQIRDSFIKPLKPEHLKKYKKNNNQVIIL